MLGEPMFTVRAMLMAEKRGRQSKGVRAEMAADSRRAKDDGPVGEGIRTALGTWPMENEQLVEYRKRVLRRRWVHSRRRSSDWRDKRRC